MYIHVLIIIAVSLENGDLLWIVPFFVASYDQSRNRPSDVVCLKCRYICNALLSVKGFTKKKTRMTLANVLYNVFEWCNWCVQETAGLLYRVGECYSISVLVIKLHRDPRPLNSHNKDDVLVVKWYNILRFLFYTFYILPESITK